MPLSLETLITEKNYTERWYPASIPSYQNNWILDYAVPNTGALAKNLSYNIQYIEFLEKEFSELNVSSVIYTMLVKTYVITSMSILEGVFSNIVHSNGWWKTSKLESLGITTSNKTNFSCGQIIVRTELFQEVDEFDLRMNLDDFIKILNKHHSALEIDHLIYPALNRLRDLRNRVHLQKAETDTDHDYNAFDYTVKKEMGHILYDILSSPKISRSPQLFDFLSVNN